MQFLLDCGISEETLRKVILNNSDKMVEDAEWNIERVVSSIQYLESLGVTTIDKILINRFDIVLRGKDSLEESFSQLEIDKLIPMINKDIKYIYYLDRY